MAQQNEPSILLNQSENDLVFTIIGHRRQSKATAKVEMFHAEQGQWKKFKTGVVCFVKDNIKKSYYIRLVDITAKSIVFEQVIHDQFTYKKDNSFFHSFPGDKCTVGLNFASKQEADKFHQAVETKVQEKQEKHQRRMTLKKKREEGQATVIRRPPVSPISDGNDPFDNLQKQGRPKHPTGNKITKSDIRLPSDFRHLSHVGFDPVTGNFDSSNIDPQWRKFLDTAGVTDAQLEDKNTANFIYEFVEKHGGIQEAYRQLEAASKKGPPPPPSRRGPPPPARGGPSVGHRGPPPLPSRHGPPPPARGGPSVGRRGLPPPPPRDSGHSGGKGNGPAPPPPPPVETDFQLKNLLEKYRHQRIIKHKSLKWLFTGPPRVGKTTLKKRLLKTIKNLITSGVVSPSGGFEKPTSVVIGETRECVTLVMGSVDWKPQDNVLDEAQMLLELIEHNHHQSPPTPAPPTPVPLTNDPSTPVLPTQISPTPAPPVPSTPGEAEADTLDDARKLMQEVLASRKLGSIEDIEKSTTVYLMDIGGQPEFHEIMPIIFNGPALHMIFFNLTFNLDDTILIRFCQQDGNDSIITYDSSYTGKQMIYQLLSSLYYFSKSLSSDSEPAAVLIGTHLDRLMDQEGQGEKKIEEINNSLKELLSNTEFHNRAFLTYPKEDENSTVFIPVNNYSGDEEEIKQLQAFVRQLIDDRFDPVELPSSWLFFHLILRHRYESSPGVCKLADCRALAKGCGLDEKDVPQVLRYIHQHLGTILFYEEVPGLNELVICDPNVLFEGIYQLVAVSFGGEKGQHTFTTDIKKTGEIPRKVIERITSRPSSSLLTKKHIFELLKHFKILTELPSYDGINYFMPCLLYPDNSLNLSREALQDLCTPPLLVRFDGNYIPIGVFSALVVKLSQSSWEPDRDSRYRNHILFHTGGLSSVELIVYPAYLEFRIPNTIYKEELEEIHQFCMKVRIAIVDTLMSVLDLHEHTRNTKFQLGFYCPGSFQADGQPHFCGCLLPDNYINPESFVCYKSPHCQDQCRLPHEHTIWFENWKNKEIAGDGGPVHETATLSSLDVSGVDSTLLEECCLRKVLDSISTLTAKWFKLGVALGLSCDTLETIECNHPKDADRCLTETVIAWLQMKDNSQPSWQSLASAISSPSVNRIEIATMIAVEHPSQAVNQ